MPRPPASALATRFRSDNARLEPRKENWYFLGAQLLMTVVLFVDSYAIAKKSWQEIDQLEENIARDQKDSESHEIHDRSM